MHEPVIFDALRGDVVALDRDCLWEGRGLLPVERVFAVVPSNVPMRKAAATTIINIGASSIIRKQVDITNMVVKNARDRAVEAAIGASFPYFITFTCPMRSVVSVKSVLGLGLGVRVMSGIGLGLG